MATLHDAMVRQGERLFRLRSLVPLLIVPAAIPAVRDFRYAWGTHTGDIAWEAISFAVALAGFAVRCLVAGYVPSGTSGRSVRGFRAQSLNTDGMYSLCRNPLYLGNFLVALGVLLFLHAPYLLVLYALLFWLHYERIILAEEEFLLRQYGDVYRAWAQTTPAFLPRVSGWRRPGRPFSWSRAARREASTLLGIAVAMTFLEAVTDRMLHGRVALETGWRWILGAGVGFYLLVWTLKRLGLLRRSGDGADPVPPQSPN